MKGAAQPIALVAAKGQIGAPVRAVAVEQTPALLRIFEQHQVLAHQAHGFDRALRHARVQGGVELIHQRGGLPIAAQQLTSGGVRAHAGDAVVLFGFHGVCSVWRRGAHDNSECPGHQRDKDMAKPEVLNRRSPQITAQSPHR